jgi:hypothetical protein
MRDQLLEIVQHTHALGIDLVKVEGTDSETVVTAIANEREAMVDGKFKGIVAEFIGTFGMPQISQLNTILNIPEYKEDAKTTIKVDSNGQPEGVHFENKTGDFENNYRFMSANIVNDKLKKFKFRGVKWGVEVEPTNLSIQRLKFQASANSEQTTFTAKTENGSLKFYFGDHSSHAGDFVFATNVSGSFSKPWAWPIQAIINILSLPGDKKLSFSDEGAAQVVVDSGAAVWTYIIPAQTK